MSTKITLISIPNTTLKTPQSIPKKPSFTKSALIPGTAEYLFTKLTAPNHTCPHLPKYEASFSTSPYPHRLGFFHISDDNISYLDTNKLCETCCADIVPNGWNAWSMLIEKDQGPEEVRRPPILEHRGSVWPARRWLVMPPSKEFYPFVSQAGCEGFSNNHEEKKSGNEETSIGAGVELSVPPVPDALKAWQWLKKQWKPFYIDQLHLVEGWSREGEKRAVLDAHISVGNAGAYKVVRKRRREKVRMLGVVEAREEMRRVVAQLNREFADQLGGEVDMNSGSDEDLRPSLEELMGVKKFGEFMVKTRGGGKR